MKYYLELNVCSVCEDEIIYTWRHEECPSDSKEYLYSEGKIRCEYCWKKLDFFDITFNCKESGNKKAKASLKKAFFYFKSLFINHEISEDFLMKIKNSFKGKEIKYNEINKYIF